jgi:type IV pilus assembly protein PilB
MLLHAGFVTPEQLAEVLERQKVEKGTRLGRLLVDLGHVTEAQICEALADQLRIPAADMAAVDIPSEVLNLLPKELALKYTCLPWFVEGRELYLIMADPTNVAAVDAAAFRTGLKVKPVVAPESEIAAALERFYSAEEQSLAQFGNISLAEQLSVVSEEDAGPGVEENLEQAALGVPLVKLVNAILADAIAAGASDVHIEPQERGVDLRYRVDGLLRRVMTMPKRVQAKVVSRIKIMSHMDISERRKPQDGRTFLRVGPRNYDLRVSTLPTADGEKCVLRILVQDRANVALEELGFAPDVLDTFKELLRRPQGMVLVTGPTGSGKTSTLYAALNFLRSETTNIVTVEDPIEYRLAGVNQVAVSEKSGMTFASGLRSILRQDPDIVMVGEIRDQETAQIAFQAAQTGHLVLSTLHTNDAPSAVTRLLELGIAPYLLNATLNGIMAQRLVRTLCPHCKLRVEMQREEDHAAWEALVAPWKSKRPARLYKPVGCLECRMTGFVGRVGIYETLLFTNPIKKLVNEKADLATLREQAFKDGMKALRISGAMKVGAGLTTVEEVLKVAPPVRDGA